MTRGDVGALRLGKAGALVAVLLVYLTTWQILISFHYPNLHDLADVARGVLDGRPRSLAFQNRLLGPWLVQVIAELGMPLEAALRRFHLALLFVLLLLLYILIRNAGAKAAEALALLSVFALSFLGLQFYWYHTWDILDLIVFTLFSWGVVTAKPLGFFIVLFLVALLNRESALFIALFILLDAFRARGIASITIVSPVRLWVGTLAIAFGIVFILILRSHLYVGPPGGIELVEGAAFGNEFHLWANLRNLFFGNFQSVEARHSLFLFLAFGFFLIKWRMLSASGVQLLLIALAIMINILIFGIVIETRNLLILLPLFVFLWVDVATRHRRRAEQAGLG
jgi:hypothetical protein